MEPSCSHSTYDTVKTLMESTAEDHSDAVGNPSEGAKAEEVVPAPGHTGSPCQHTIQEKDVFHGILKCLREIDASLKKVFPTDKSEEESDNTKARTKPTEIFSETILTSVREWNEGKLISTIKTNPKLMLQTSSWGSADQPPTMCNVFQLAVILNYHEMVKKMLSIAMQHLNGVDRQELVGAFKVEGVELTALDFALICGNKCIVQLLRRAINNQKIDETDFPPGLEHKQGLLNVLRPILNGRIGDDLPNKTVREMLISARSVTPRTTLWWGTPFGVSLRGADQSLRDEDDLFVLHCIANICTDRNGSDLLLRENLEKICTQITPKNIFLLLRHTDNHGETPLHVLCGRIGGTVDELRKGLEDFMSVVAPKERDTGFNFFDVRDLAGRTCVHIAAANGRESLLTAMADIDCDNFKAVLNVTYGEEKTTALHLAVMHGHNKCVKVLLKYGCDTNILCNRKITFKSDKFGSKSLKFGGAFQMAAMEGQEELLRTLLKDKKLRDRGMTHQRPKRGDSRDPQMDMTPALQLAAHSGNPLAVQILLNSGKFDPSAFDLDGDTALHSVAGWEVEKKYIQLGDFADPSHYKNTKSLNPARFNPGEQKISLVGIKACLDLLMQGGLDMDQRNASGEPPQFIRPAQDELTEELTRWWYEKFARQNQETKTNLVAAANAVSVTAALVATASFVGPLQPPLGLSPSTDAWLTGYSQVNHTAVQVFLFCDSLSFYFAIASIMLAIIPSLTIPQEGLYLEVRTANRVVQIAVFLLFTSITFVICAFSAASIAIVPESRWHYKALAVVSTIVGTVICSSALCLFLLRLMRLISPKNTWAIHLTDTVFRYYRKPGRSDLQVASQVDKEATS